MKNSKLRIFDAALEHVSEVGLDRSKLNPIAESCGVVRGTLIHHFKSKHGIFIEMFKLYFDELSNYSVDGIGGIVDSKIMLNEAWRRRAEWAFSNVDRFNFYVQMNCLYPDLIDTSTDKLNKKLSFCVWDNKGELFKRDNIYSLFVAHSNSLIGSLIDKRLLQRVRDSIIDVGFGIFYKTIYEMYESYKNKNYSSDLKIGKINQDPHDFE